MTGKINRTPFFAWPTFDKSLRKPHSQETFATHINKAMTMRSILETIFDPFIERLAERLDQTVAQDDHMAFARRVSVALAHLLFGPQAAPNDIQRLAQFSIAQIALRVHAELSIPILGASSGENMHGHSDALAFVDRWDPAHAELGLDLVLLATGAFSDSSRSDQSTLQSERLLVENLRSQNHANSHVPLRWAMALLNLHRAGVPDEVFSVFDDEHSSGARGVCFQDKCTRYGASYILHSLLTLQSLNRQAARAATARELAERMLKRVELTRSHKLRFCEAVPATLADIEMLRIARALLRAAQDFHDLRYLNAALKMLDQIYRSLIPRGLVKRLDSESFQLLLAHVHYLDALAHQERVWREMVHQQ